MNIFRHMQFNSCIKNFPINHPLQKNYEFLHSLKIHYFFKKMQQTHVVTVNTA